MTGFVKLHTTAEISEDVGFRDAEAIVLALLRRYGTAVLEDPEKIHRAECAARIDSRKGGE